MNLLCRLGIHSSARGPEPLAPPGDSRETRVCRRCGKPVGSGPGLFRWSGGVRGMTVGELRAALEGVPDDIEVEVESSSQYGWKGAESAFMTSKTPLTLDDPQTVPVFRIAGAGVHAHGGGLSPGIGS